MGRPSSYTPEIANEICERIAGGENLHKICGEDGTPNRATIYNWFRVYPEFFDDYMRAREDRADWRADRIDDIVARMISGEIDSKTARVAIDAEKWQAGKEKPQQYGDKLDLNHGGQPGNPVVHQIELTAPGYDESEN